MFGEQNRRALSEPPGRSGIKKGRVLVGMDHCGGMPLCKCRQAPHATDVQSFAASRHLDNESLFTQFQAECSELIQAHEDETKPVLKPPRQPGGKHFGAADFKCV